MSNKKIIPSNIIHPGELAPFPLNSNEHPGSQIDELAESRRLFNQYRNVVVWKCPEDMEIDHAGQIVELKQGITYVLAGNGFHAASIKRQDDSIEVKDYSHLTLDEAILLAETDNAAPLGSKINPELMAANLERARGLVVDNEQMSRMLEGAKELAGVNGKEKLGLKTMKSGIGGGYNGENLRDIEPVKVAFRLEAAWKSTGLLGIDLFSGKGELAYFYRRRFKQLITNDYDKQYDTDYSLKVSEFINNHLADYIAFDFVDFDDEGTPALEIQRFFSVIKGRKADPFILCLTDGAGLNMKVQGRMNLGKLYLQENEGIRQCTSNDFHKFEETVMVFIDQVASDAEFMPTMLSSYCGRGGNVVYQTWLIEPS